MSTNTVFHNLYGTIITSSQSELADSYYKLSYVDNELKTKFSIFNNKILNVDYYLSAGEDINVGLGSLDPQYSWTVYTNKQIINTYTVWDARRVVGNSLESLYSKVVLNTNNQTVAIFSYTPGNEIIEGFKKFDLGGKNILDDGNIEGVFGDDADVFFKFDNAGIKEIDTSTEIFLKPYKTLSIFFDEQQGGPILSLMTPDMVSYYTNILPLVPNF